MKIKNIVQIVFLFALSISGLMAQKITQKNELILVDGNPYLYISKENNGEKTILKVKTLDQKLIVLAISDDNVSYYELTFLQTSEVGYLQSSLMGMSKKIAKEFYSNNVISGNSINEEGKKIFLLICKQKPENLIADQEEPSMVINHSSENTNNNPANNSNNTNALVARNRVFPIIIIGSNISQENQIIGTTTNQTTAANGHLYQIYKFYLPNGTMVAEATYTGMSSNQCVLVTLKDNRRQTITATRNASSPKNIVELLVRDYYL